MNKRLIAIIVAVGVIAFGAGAYLKTGSIQDKPNNQVGKDKLQDQVKTPHFLDSTPLDNEVYAAQPINVTINFNFDLIAGSKISVTDENGKEWTEGPDLIEDVDTALKRSLKRGMPDGQYKVEYTACWPDKSCHEGRFDFNIDQKEKSDYKDLRGNPEVTINIKDLKFENSEILISPGTKVKWINMDEVGHYVNTETHPEHTYYPEQNSRELLKDKEFAMIFTVPGQYNYHCSAHADIMKASLIVSE